MKRALFLLLFLTSCHHTQPDSLVSIQIQDRNGLTETISAPDRLSNYHQLDFLASQPYKKVLRVFKEAGKHTAKVTTYHPNGLIHKYLEAQDMRAFGAYKEWHPNGQLKVEATVIGGSADVADGAEQDWLFDGMASSYDSEGRLCAKVLYEKGLLEGVSVYFFPNGKVEKQLRFHQHVLDGESVVFGADGTLREKTVYEKGLKRESSGFWPNGNPSWVEKYENGLLQDGKYQSVDGQTVSEVKQGCGFQVMGQTHTEYKQGKPEGLVKQFSVQGELISTHHMLNNQKHGEELFYYPGQKPKLSISWQHDTISGLVKTWHPNGELQSQREFSQNKKTGPALFWYATGQLMSVEEYEEDALVKGDYFKPNQKDPVSSVLHGNGWATLYDSNGLFLRKVQYIKGKLVDPE